MPINPEKEARMRAAATSVGRPREAQSVSRSPRNAGDLDDFVSLETELAAALEKLAAFKVALDKSRAECAELRAAATAARWTPVDLDSDVLARRADLAERNLAASTARVDELERETSRLYGERENLAAEVRRLGGEVASAESSLARRRAPDVEEVTDLALRHGVISMRILSLRASRNGGRPYANNDRTPVDEATLIATRAALQEVLACRMSGTEASRTAEVLVAREIATTPTMESEGW